jgi:hypothetical protein
VANDTSGKYKKTIKKEKIFMSKNQKKVSQKRGPKSDRLIVDGNWQEAIKKAIKRKKPAEGWPDKKKKP